MEIIEVMSSLVEKLQLQRFSTEQEKLTQMDVECFLASIGICFEREKHLSDRDIPDFLIHTPAGSVVLEVKTRCARKAIYRQLERYAQHQVVAGIILLTGTSMGLPPEIKGKPSVVASIGAGWL
ncbi:hypothetical protein ABHN11_24755 [Brevibacillus centrosporus]|uniref:hypothetical protein n=1 Tax=Brevibacillus centrosporus TaxID=54910 RepID=UPI003D238CBF